MSDRIKDATVIVVFVIVLIFVLLINVISKDKDISDSERRKLASFPEITKETVMDGDLSEDFESYFSDQFVGRDFLRSLKTTVSLNVFRQKDNNELFVKDNSIYKMEYKLNEKDLEKSINKINEICDKYLKNMNVYYSIIPDKNYYLEDDDHLKLDFEKIEKTMKNSLKNLKYIDISDCLNLNDYYKTDLHWKQENLNNVTSCLKSEMGLKDTNSQYKLLDRGDFYGAYFGQLGAKIEPDRLYTLTNDEIENCVTYNFETKRRGRVYETPKTSDKYDVYLSGAVPLIKIDNPNSKTDKDLILFRDSFGSSLAPLLIDSYKTITLVDIRYISPKILDQYIDFTSQDVLFLYSTVVLNQNIFK